jgi:hypothetical protein
MARSGKAFRHIEVLIDESNGAKIVYKEPALYVDMMRNKEDAMYWANNLKRQKIPFKLVQCETTEAVKKAASWQNPYQDEPNKKNPIRFFKGYAIFVHIKEEDVLNEEEMGEENGEN